MAYGRSKKTGGSVRDYGINTLNPANDDFPYGIWSTGGGDTGARGGTKSAGVRLTVGTPDGVYDCRSVKSYTEKSSIIQDISAGTSSSVEGLVTISSFSKNLGALTVHNAKAIVLKNISNVSAEVVIGLYDWRNDSGGTTIDVTNSVDMNEENSTGEETNVRFISMLLPANDFIYLPNSRFLSYSPLASTTTESAANASAGDIAIEPKDINSGNEFRGVRLMSGSTYGTGTEVLTDEPVAIGETAIDVDDGDWFKAGDLIMIDDEVMEVESISTNTLTVKRGLLGSTEVTHTEDDELLYFFGNEHLPFNNGKCMTSQTGSFSQRGAFFGYGRSADKKKLMV